jgi:hypothetical protein
LSWIAFSESKKLVVSEMVCMSLERMELSDGIKNLDRKIPRTQSSRITLLPSKRVVSLIKAEKQKIAP